MSTSDWMSSAAKATPSADPKAERLRVEAEQRRLTAQTAVELRQRQAELDHQERQRAAQRRQEREDRRQTIRARRTARVRATLPVVGRRVMIVGPILMPMSVAWIGQIQFANDTLGWPLAGALVFAAAWELTTAFAGWMYHQARQQGDRGTLFRFATWLFAASAGGMNYWHALGQGHSVTSPTPKAVSYGAMSLVGIALWELYASLIHRQQLRADGKLPAARPRFGVARWARFPRITFRAWSLSIRDGLATTEQAWAAARDGRATFPAPTIQATARRDDQAATKPVTVPWDHAITMPPVDAWHANQPSHMASHEYATGTPINQATDVPADQATTVPGTDDGTPLAWAPDHATEPSQTEAVTTPPAKPADKPRTRTTTKPRKGGRPSSAAVEGARQIVRANHAKGVEMTDRGLVAATEGAVGRTAAARIIAEERAARRNQASDRATTNHAKEATG